METDTSAPAEKFNGKKNVARQILHQAIVSIFNGDNPLAVHLMAQALEASLSDLFRAAGHRPVYLVDQTGSKTRDCFSHAQIRKFLKARR